MGERPAKVGEEERGTISTARLHQEKDAWLVIGNAKTGTIRMRPWSFCSRDALLSLFRPVPGGPKVYDVTQYLDDHPGGAEVR